MPDKETRHALESDEGITWREDQEVEGRRFILRNIKEKWENVKPSALRIIENSEEN